MSDAGSSGTGGNPPGGPIGASAEPAVEACQAHCASQQAQGCITAEELSGCAGLCVASWTGALGGECGDPLRAFFECVPLHPDALATGCATAGPVPEDGADTPCRVEYEASLGCCCPEELDGA